MAGAGRRGRNCYTGRGAGPGEDSRVQHRFSSEGPEVQMQACDRGGGSRHKVTSDCIYFSEFSLREASWGKRC